MIEILLQAERVLTMGMVDQAERLYRQAADADPRNSIAVVGLARVALERGDEPASWRFAMAALQIDPENVAAQRLAARLEEVWAYRGESLPDVARAQVTADAEAAAPAMGATAMGATSSTSPEAAAPEPTAPEPSAPAAPEAAAPEPAAPEPAAPEAPPHRGVVDRLFRRIRP